MTTDLLPRSAEDVLDIPDRDMPETLRALLQYRALSGLVQRLHGTLASGDAQDRRMARQALTRLGFVE